MKTRACFINIGCFDQVDDVKLIESFEMILLTKLAMMEALLNSKILGASVDLSYAPDL